MKVNAFIECNQYSITKCVKYEHNTRVKQALVQAVMRLVQSYMYCSHVLNHYIDQPLDHESLLIMFEINYAR